MSYGWISQDKIVWDWDLNPREEDESHIRALANHMNENGYNAKYPVIVYELGNNYYHAATGHHRLEASVLEDDEFPKLPLVEVYCEIRQGTRTEMIKQMLTDNFQHVPGFNFRIGKMPDRREIREMRRRLLLFPENFIKSDRLIAKEWGCDHRTISEMRNEIINRLSTAGEYTSSFNHLNAPTSYVYFILAHESEKIKIGRTTRNPERRLKAIQASSDETLELIRVIGGGNNAEQKIHQKFDAMRISGEWFKYTPEIREYIERTDNIAVMPKDYAGGMSLGACLNQIGDDVLEKLAGIIKDGKYVGLDGKKHPRKTRNNETAKEKKDDTSTESPPDESETEVENSENPEVDIRYRMKNMLHVNSKISDEDIKIIASEFDVPERILPKIAAEEYEDALQKYQTRHWNARLEVSDAWAGFDELKEVADLNYLQKIIEVRWELRAGLFDDDECKNLDLQTIRKELQSILDAAKDIREKSDWVMAFRAYEKMKEDLYGQVKISILNEVCDNVDILSHRIKHEACKAKGFKDKFLWDDSIVPSFQTAEEIQKYTDLLREIYTNLVFFDANYPENSAHCKVYLCDLYKEYEKESEQKNTSASLDDREANKLRKQKTQVFKQLWDKRRQVTRDYISDGDTDLNQNVTLEQLSVAFVKLHDYCAEVFRSAMERTSRHTYADALERTLNSDVSVETLQKEFQVMSTYAYDVFSWNNGVESTQWIRDMVAKAKEKKKSESKSPQKEKTFFQVVVYGGSEYNPEKDTVLTPTYKFCPSPENMQKFNVSIESGKWDADKIHTFANKIQEYLFEMVNDPDMWEETE